MKKISRNPEKFDVLELFASMAAEHGYDFNDPVAHNDFIKRVRSSFEKSKQSATTVFGKRIESLFAYVAGALGKVQLLKQEDAGELFFDGEGILAPDYRLTMFDGSQLLVEVKNCHFKEPQQKFTVKKKYYEKLKLYSDINGLDLYFAIYFSAWNHWSLLPISSFNEAEEEYSVDLGIAMAKSEMAKLGDCMLGAAPNLELHLLANPHEASEIDDTGKASFITRNVKIFCAGQEVKNDLEKRIAFYLMRFGDWTESENEAIVHGNKLLGIKFVYSPEQQDEPNFAMIGYLSRMVSNGFKELTVKDGEVVALTLGIDPSVFRILIPENYKGTELPLWRFKLQANPNFSGFVNGAES